MELEIRRSCSEAFCPECDQAFTVRNTEELSKLGQSLRFDIPKAIVHCLQIEVIVAGETLISCVAATVIPSDPVELIISRPEWEMKCPMCEEPVRMIFPIYPDLKDCHPRQLFGHLRSIEDCTELLTVTGKFLKHGGENKLPRSGITHVIVRA